MMERESAAPEPETSPVALQPEQKDLDYSDLKNRPEVVLSLLEPDQLVITKERTRFGAKRLSAGTRALLWALRIYVVVMLILVAVSAYHAIQAAR